MLPRLASNFRSALNTSRPLHLPALPCSSRSFSTAPPPEEGAPEGAPCALFEEALAHLSSSPPSLPPAISLLARSAAGGSPDGNFFLGMAYDNVLPGSPEHLDRDEGAAVRCYRRAAEKDHAQAMFNLALSLRDGGGGDVEEGFDWMRRAADTGDVRAQYNAGIARDPNHKPWGVPGRDMLEKDGGEAVKFYRMAAEGGHSKAEVNLGVAL